MVMGKGIQYKVAYAPQVRKHLKAIEPKYYSLIRGEIESQLEFEPTVETRNRKPLRRPADIEGEWELRIGHDNRFRVFYSVDVERHEVLILAIGVKEGNRLFIGGEEVKI
jgi:mRNA-degrading endonuclease RelE of RelBE toxin-antitoxin system